MLETLREYALEQLSACGEAEETRDRHARYYLTFTQEGGEHYAGSEVITWLAQVGVEYNNLREALAWCLGAQESHERVPVNGGQPAHDGEEHGRELELERELERVRIGADLCSALFPFWDGQNYLSEARSWYARAADKIAALLQATEYFRQGASATSMAMDLSSELHVSWARMLTGVGIMAYYQGDYEGARSYNENGLAMRRELGDRSGVAACLNNLGIASIDQGDYEAARNYLSESLTIARELGIPWKLCAALGNLGVVETRLGNFAEARSFLEESLAIAREADDFQRLADALSYLGVLDQF